MCCHHSNIQNIQILETVFFLPVNSCGARFKYFGCVPRLSLAVVLRPALQFALFLYSKLRSFLISLIFCPTFQGIKTMINNQQSHICCEDFHWLLVKVSVANVHGREQLKRRQETRVSLDSTMMRVWLILLTLNFKSLKKFKQSSDFLFSRVKFNLFFLSFSIIYS